MMVSRARLLCQEGGQPTNSFSSSSWVEPFISTISFSSPGRHLVLLYRRSLPVCCSMLLLHTISFSFHTNNNNSMITGEKHKYAAGFPKSSSVLACNSFFTPTKSKSINQHLVLLPASIQSNSQMRKRSIDCPGRRQWRIRWFFFFV